MRWWLEYTCLCVRVCHVLLAGQYLVRICPRPLAHLPPSEPFPPPPPLLPPSLPASHAAVSPHHQTQTSVWRPRRVRPLAPAPSFLIPLSSYISLWCYCGVFMFVSEFILHLCWFQHDFIVHYIPIFIFPQGPDVFSFFSYYWLVWRRTRSLQ